MLLLRIDMLNHRGSVCMQYSRFCVQNPSTMRTHVCSPRASHLSTKLVRLTPVAAEPNKTESNTRKRSHLISIFHKIWYSACI